MEISYDQLSLDALDGLVREFVSRDGTDYGAVEVSLERKVEEVIKQLKQGKAIITYDEETQTCNIVEKNT